MRKQRIEPTTKVWISEEPHRHSKAILEYACEQVLPIGLPRAHWLWAEDLPAWLERRRA